MQKEAKTQVERKVVDILGGLYGKFTRLSDLEESDKEWLRDAAGISTERAPEIDAAGINDDWPIGRGVFINDDRSFAVLVNFDDHLIIITIHTSQENGVAKMYKQFVKVLKAFENIGYATDPYLGNLTVSPGDLGTGIATHGTVIY